MATIVTVAEVQAWLEKTKYVIESVDADLEKTARSLVFGRLASARYDTTVWVTSLTTPELVRRIVAMLVAAWEYDRATAEDQLEGSSYADKLERRALALLQAIIDGDMTIPGVEPDDSQGSILFFPTDAETLERAPGSLTGYGLEDHSRRFEIGQVF